MIGLRTVTIVLRAFIVIDSSTDECVLEGIADLYCDVFREPPWGEEWPPGVVLQDLNTAMSYDGFVGSTCLDDRVLGFCWGFTVPCDFPSRVGFAILRDRLLAEGIRPADCFYDAETGVSKDYRDQGLATSLLSDCLSRSALSYLAMRTKNPAMIAVARNLCGEALFSFSEESAYAGGRVYVFEVQDGS